VLANRLSVDASQRVLLIEAGGRDSNINFRIPLMIVHLLKDERFTWPFVTEPRKYLNDRTQLWVRGRVLGGSSSINGNVYVRGDPAEFDSWRSQGRPGWGNSDLLPYFKRMEKFPEGDPS
jgi:choline dehydrogenase-like flavoprotein